MHEIYSRAASAKFFYTEDKRGLDLEARKRSYLTRPTSRSHSNQLRTHVHSSLAIAFLPTSLCTLSICLINHALFRLLKAGKQIVDLLLQIREIRLENLGSLFTSE
jgi:hypothetical protein